MNPRPDPDPPATTEPFPALAALVRAAHGRGAYDATPRPRGPRHRPAAPPAPTSAPPPLPDEPTTPFRDVNVTSI
jgi:hypothetical protein